MLMCLTGCDNDNARFLTQTTTTITTTTTTAMSPGRFQLMVQSLINYKGGEGESPLCSASQTLVPGESVNLSEHSGNPSDCFFTDTQCRGVCGSLTLTGIFNESQFSLIARPFDSALCPDEEITITRDTDARVCSLKRENITCTTPTPWTPNVWDPETDSVIEMTFCSDMNPRLRCNSANSRCWYVPETRVCPSGPDQCTLDPTCTCGEGMVQTTVLSSTHAWNDSDMTFDVGAWCWRCEPRTQPSCEDPQFMFPHNSDIYYPKTCASESSCNCPESDSWVRPVIKRAFYTDANRTELVPKGTPGALKCFACEREGESWKSKEIMEIETALTVSILSGQ
jgi:hypothetical protein